MVAGSVADVNAGTAFRVGFVASDDLAGDGGGVAAAEQEVADHVHQGAAFGPGEVAVRPHTGGVPQGQKDGGYGVGRCRGLGAQDAVAVHFDAVDGEGVTEVGRVDDLDLEEEHVGRTRYRVRPALFAFL